MGGGRKFQFGRKFFGTLDKLPTQLAETLSYRVRRCNSYQMNRSKKPLFRKVNTKARGVRHHFGGDFKYSRNAKRASPEREKGSMHGKQERGYDYTPLFRFLLSKVGEEWDAILREAASRLNTTDPIFWVVALKPDDKVAYVRTGESTYFSGMYVDEEGNLRLTNPDLQAKDMTPLCSCCTHTLNGVRFGGECG